MKPTTPLALVLLAGAALLSGCADQVARKSAAQAQATIQGAPESLTRLDAYLRDQYAWELKVADALCQVEENTRGLDPTKRLCPSGGTGLVPPPAYPPK